MEEEHKTLKIETARKFLPMLQKSRYKGLYGGRGSAKSHFFSELLIEHHILYPSLRSVCIREVQKSLAQSAKKLIEDKLLKFDLQNKGFKIFSDKIQAPGDGIIIFQGMQDHTSESIKSLEGFGIAWCEEAQTLSERSLLLLRPTIRDSNIDGFEAEIWFSWNPTRKIDAVDNFFRSGHEPKNSIVIKANWDSNPWFPDVLKIEREQDKINQPDSYNHVWEGGYVEMMTGAYFVKNIMQARKENRIGFVPRNDLMHFYAFFDIGGTGAKSDACVIWIAQFIGLAIHVIDHYEVVGQELKDHVHWLNKNEYTTLNTKIFLPHDGVKHDSVYRVTYESELKKAGYTVKVVGNAGTGAAMQRVLAIRSIFHRVFIDKNKCKYGLQSLGWYHEKRHHKTQKGLGPDHDWSSHSCDAFGMIALEVPNINKPKRNNTNNKIKKINNNNNWMS